MQWFLIDAIGPFFRGDTRRRINWSKIPFPQLATHGPQRVAQWSQIREDMRRFVGKTSALGYNTVTLDDLAHLAKHPLHEPHIAENIGVFREEFAKLFDLIRSEGGMKILLTSDVIPITPALDREFGTDRQALDDYYAGLVRGVLDDFPQLSGMILRIGECDGNDIKDPIRTRLHVRTPQDTNRMLHQLLPEFEARNRQLVLRTWTVGAHRIGDLIWHRRTLTEALRGIDSPHFAVSMKHGESDFFRYLPLNQAFYRIQQPKILELQARREYEGAGEFPAFIGADCERFTRELSGVPNVIGLSVWCQTGGWHRFRRLAFLEDDARDVWIRLNATAAIRIFKDHKPLESAVSEIVGPEHTTQALELLRHADTAINELMYIEDFARLKLFFRRVRIPPLLHVYWDCIFINHAVRKVLRHFVPDPERAVRAGEAAASLFPRMLELARQAKLPVDDLEHMRDVFCMIQLARRYYFLPYDPELAQRIRIAKKTYKRRWPRNDRQRYRLKLNFVPFKVKRRTLAWLSGMLLRDKRGYRVIDHMFTLHLLGFIFRAFQPRNMPKFLRKSAMGVESVFR